jgi:hypothetical protein
VKWKRRFVIVLAVFGFMLIAHETALAASTSYREVVPRWLGGIANRDITISFTPEVPGGAPTHFTATYVSDNVVRLDWANAANVTAVAIRAKYNSYPTGPTDGYQVFYGMATSALDTSVDWNSHLGTAYYIACSENITGGFSDPALASLESPGMTTFNALLLGTILPIVLLIGFVGLAFWYKTTFLFIFAGVACLGFAALWIFQSSGTAIAPATHAFMFLEAILSVLLGIYTLVKGLTPPYTW